MSPARRCECGAPEGHRIGRYFRDPSLWVSLDADPSFTARYLSRSFPNTGVAELEDVDGHLLCQHCRERSRGRPCARSAPERRSGEPGVVQGDRIGVAEAGAESGGPVESRPSPCPIAFAIVEKGRPVLRRAFDSFSRALRSADAYGTELVCVAVVRQDRYMLGLYEGVMRELERVDISDHLRELALRLRYQMQGIEIEGRGARARGGRRDRAEAERWLASVESCGSPLGLWFSAHRASCAKVAAQRQALRVSLPSSPSQFTEISL